MVGGYVYVCVREWRGERDLSKLESKAWFAMEEIRERERERNSKKIKKEYLNKVTKEIEVGMLSVLKNDIV